PELFEADAKFLRFAILVEAKFGDELLGERAARALGNQRIFAEKLDAPGKAAFEAAIAGNSHIAGRDAHNLAAAAIYKLRARKSGKNIDAQGLRFAAQKANEIAERTDKIAVIAHQPRHDEIRQPDRAGLRKHVEAVGCHFGCERPLLILAPAGN